MKTTPSQDSSGNLAPEGGFGPDNAVVPGLGMFLIRAGLLALLGFGAARFGLGMGPADQLGKTAPPARSIAGKG